MFNNATSLLFYVANLQSFVSKIRGVNKVDVYTVCPPGIDSLVEYGYNRAIHLSLKFIVNVMEHPVQVFYMTFRYSLPHRAPSKFSSIEIFNQQYQSVIKFKYLDGADNFFVYLQNFEQHLKEMIANPTDTRWTPVTGLVGAQ